MKAQALQFYGNIRFKAWSCLTGDLQYPGNVPFRPSRYTWQGAGVYSDNHSSILLYTLQVTDYEYSNPVST